jgi:hypothetical protein
MFNKMALSRVTGRAKNKTKIVLLPSSIHTGLIYVMLQTVGKVLLKILSVPWSLYGLQLDIVLKFWHKIGSFEMHE